MTFKKTEPKSPKKTLVELLSTKEVIAGKDVIHQLKKHMA